MPVPSGLCHCGEVGLYYANRKHFCKGHYLEARDAAKNHRVPVVNPEIFSNLNFGMTSADVVFRRHVDRPRHSI